MERWLLRGNRNSATGLIADLNERVATPVMFGGGTLAVVLNAGRARGQERGPRRDAGDDDGSSRPGTRWSSSTRASRAPRRRSRSAWPMPSRPPAAWSASSSRPRVARSTGWIEAEARERGLDPRPGTAKLLAERIGGNRPGGRRGTPPPDADRVDGARQARALPRHGADRPDDVTALVAEAVPGSVWAFTDAVGERRVEQALELPRPAPRDDAGAGPPRGPPSARPRADRDRRPAGGRRAPARRSARRWASTASTGWSKLRDQAKALDDGGADRRARRPGRARCDGQGGARRGTGGRAATAGVQSLGDRPRRRATGGRPPDRQSAGRTRPAPGRRGRSRWRRRSGPRRGRAARSARDRCTAASSPRTGRPGCRSTAARCGRAGGRSCRTGS